MPLKTFQAIHPSILWGIQFLSMYELRCHSGEDVGARRSRFPCQGDTLLTAACVPFHFLCSALVKEQTSCGVGTMQSSDSQTTGHGRVISLSSKIAPQAPLISLLPPRGHKPAEEWVDPASCGWIYFYLVRKACISWERLAASQKIYWENLTKNIK